MAIELSVNHINQILAVLAEKPFKEVFEVIDAIRSECAKKAPSPKED